MQGSWMKLCDDFSSRGRRKYGIFVIHILGKIIAARVRYIPQDIGRVGKLTETVKTKCAST